MVAAALHTVPPPTPVARSVEYYVPLPRRLAEDLRDSPVAIGAYCLIARLYRIFRAPVPLSPGDLRSLDPSLSYGAATRALRRLTDSPYVVVGRVRGRKNSYVPTWGTVSGAVLPWDLGAPCLGRPRHVAELRLDQRLFDTCLGRVRPHAEHPAIVERYVAQPLLGLEEVGAYGAALAGIAPTAGRLVELGLLDGSGRPQPLPDDPTLLAIASQRAIGCENGGGALTAAGWARTPFHAEAPAAHSAGQALFFVPEAQIGEGIGAMIAHPISLGLSDKLPCEASGSAPEPLDARAAGSHGMIEKQEVDRSTNRQTLQVGGGITEFRNPPRESSQPSTTHDPALAPAQTPVVEEPAGAQLLRGIGVRRSVSERLAVHPQEQIAQVIAQARARGDVHDLAGWVVSALRELPETQPAGPARPKVSDRAILMHPELTHAERTRWLTRFRSTDGTERLAVLERFTKEHPHEQPT